MATSGWMIKSEPRDDNWVMLEDLELPNNLGGKLKAMKDFKKFEKELEEEGYRGWLAFTKLDNFKMIRLYDVLGAVEYMYDPKENNILFCKEFKKIQEEK